MKSSALIVALCVCAPLPAYSISYDVAGIFEQLNPDGDHSWGGWADSVTGTYDSDTGAISLYLENLWGFYNIPIVGQVFTSPGSYSWEACLPDGSVQCTAPTPITADVAAGQWAMHGLYAWTTSPNIDTVSVWDVTPGANGIIYLAAVDGDGNGVPGVGEVDGPFPGFSIALDLTLTPTAVPLPAAAWFLASGLLGLIGVIRRSKAA